MTAPPSDADRSRRVVARRGLAGAWGYVSAWCLAVSLAGCSPMRQNLNGPTNWSTTPPAAPAATGANAPAYRTSLPAAAPSSSTSEPAAHSAHREPLTIRGQGPYGGGRSLQPAAPMLPPGPNVNYQAQPAPVYQAQPGVNFQPPQRPAYEAIPQNAPAPNFGLAEQPGLGQSPLLGSGPIPPENQIFETPGKYVPLDAYLQETQTGRFMFGVGVNSDAGLVGSIIVDEQNFDWRRVPSSFEEVRNGTAFRGAGQRLRLEAAPGTEVQRYMINFSEPYLFDTPVSLGLSGFYYTRQFRDYTEERLGGRVSTGYQFSPDLTGSVALRAEQIDISNPRFPTPQDLIDVLGSNSLYSVRGQVAHDTRDNTFLATEGHYIELAFEQAFGDFVFPKATVDMRKYFLVTERPDGSGRHVLSLSGRVGVSGEDTPLFERFFAGGFSTLRGFEFRGASPVDSGVIVGGEFQALGSVEYLFPITADDMLRGVAFVDFGTVERTANFDSDNLRVAPGVGLRITIPAMGPAPIALDFAFPIAKADDDNTQVFSFFVGFGR